MYLFSDFSLDVVLRPSLDSCTFKVPPCRGPLGLAVVQQMALLLHVRTVSKLPLASMGQDFSSQSRKPLASLRRLA